jgi:hypothetical protein
MGITIVVVLFCLCHGSWAMEEHHSTAVPGGIMAAKKIRKQRLPIISCDSYV